MNHNTTDTFQKFTKKAKQYNSTDNKDKKEKLSSVAEYEAELGGRVMSTNEKEQLEKAKVLLKELWFVSSNGWKSKIDELLKQLNKQ